MTRKNIIIIAILTILFVSAYQGRYFLISKAPERTRPFFTNLVDGVINNTINEFDFTKIYKKEELPNDDYIDLTLSGDDLNHISKSMKLFIDEGYIRDEFNLSQAPGVKKAIDEFISDNNFKSEIIFERFAKIEKN